MYYVLGICIVFCTYGPPYFSLTLHLLKHYLDNLLLATDQGVIVNIEVHDAKVHSLTIHLLTCRGG